MSNLTMEMDREVLVVNAGRRDALRISQDEEGWLLTQAHRDIVAWLPETDWSLTVAGTLLRFTRKDAPNLGDPSRPMPDFYEFRVGELHVLRFHRVPSRSCPSCGHRYGEEVMRGEWLT